MTRPRHALFFALAGAACLVGATGGADDGERYARRTPTSLPERERPASERAPASAAAPLPAPAPASTTPSAPTRDGSCPAGMVLVEGEYCPRVEQTCLRWMDPPGPYHQYRCAEYGRPARCLAPRQHRRFCIDRTERTEPASGTVADVAGSASDAAGALPLARQSWTDARRVCEAAGARVCKDSEWTFACEGEELRPYPYGFERAADKCNADHVDLLIAEGPASDKPGARKRTRLRDEREPAGAHPACASPFGLLDMAGNVAEWVSVDGFAPGSVVVQKGNWWQPGKHACRDEQAGHDRFYQGIETGFRCCL